MRSSAHHKKRQSRTTWLPSLFLTKKQARRSSKSYVVWISRKQKLTIKLRNFRTPRKHHNKANRVVVRLPLGAIRELAIDRKKYVKIPKSNEAKLQVRSKPAMSLAIVVFGFIGVLLFGSQTFSSQEEFYVPNVVVAQAPQVIERTPNDNQFLAPSTPQRIIIDAIDVEADIITVGLLADNTMETPPYSRDDAGWYKHSPTPGELGPAIINGHVGTKRGPSVFWDLNKVKVGNVVTITRADGSSVDFTVTNVEQYDITQFPTEKVYGDIETAGLRLITCGGTFDKNSQRYSHNTVVYAEMIR